MATTRLISLHQNGGKSVALCLAERIDYILDGAKTEDGEHVSTYGCDVRTAAAEFALAKRLYDDYTGRTQKRNVIAYQIRQSFKPGEVDAKTANQIAYKLAMSFTKGKYPFVVATHTDKKHVHSHVIFNSTSLDSTKKFRDFLGSGKTLAKISDILCIEHGLSIVEVPEQAKRHYGKWLGDKKPLSNSDKLRLAIDKVLSLKPENFDSFLRLMEQEGYTAKIGKHIAFIGGEQQKYIRLSSLGDEYSKDIIEEIISGKKPQSPKNHSAKTAQNKLDILVNIQQKINEGKGGGYTYWANIHNAKEKAKTLNFMRENNLNDYDELSKIASDASAVFDEMNAKMKADQKRLDEIKELQMHIRNYVKTKDVYADYRKSGYSKKFFEEHRLEITLHKASKSAFDLHGAKKLPTLKSLNAEFSAVLAQKNRTYSQYKEAKRKMQDYVRAKNNVDIMLGIAQEKRAKEKSQETKKSL